VSQVGYYVNLLSVFIELGVRYFSLFKSNLQQRGGPFDVSFIYFRRYFQLSLKWRSIIKLSRTHTFILDRKLYIWIKPTCFYFSLGIYAFSTYLTYILVNTRYILTYCSIYKFHKWPLCNVYLKLLPNVTFLQIWINSKYINV